MTIHDRGFAAAQRAHDCAEPPEFYEDYDPDGEECCECIFFKYDSCQAMGETTTMGDCPSFKD